MIWVYVLDCLCAVLMSGLVRVEVLVYGSKYFCWVLVRRANSGIGLWVEM